MPLRELGIMCKEILEACKKYKKCDLGTEYEVPIKALIEHLESWPEYELAKEEGDIFKVLESYTDQMIYGVEQIHTIDCRKFGAEIAQDCFEEEGKDLNIDHIYEAITDALHDGIKADIAYYAFKYLEDNDIQYEE